MFQYTRCLCVYNFKNIRLRIGFSPVLDKRKIPFVWFFYFPVCVSFFYRNFTLHLPESAFFLCFSRSVFGHLYGLLQYVSVKTVVMKMAVVFSVSMTSPNEIKLCTAIGFLAFDATNSVINTHTHTRENAKE